MIDKIFDDIMIQEKKMDNRTLISLIKSANELRYDRVDLLDFLYKTVVNEDYNNFQGSAQKEKIETYLMISLAKLG